MILSNPFTSASSNRAYSLYGKARCPGATSGMFEQHAAAAFDEEDGGDRHIVVLVLVDDLFFCTFRPLVFERSMFDFLTFCDHHLMASETPS